MVHNTLERNIITSTRNSALNDNRFPPVRREEVDELEDTISATITTAETIEQLAEEVKTLKNECMKFHAGVDLNKK